MENENKLLDDIIALRNRYKEQAKDAAKERDEAESKRYLNHYTGMSYRTVDYEYFVSALDAIIRDYKKSQNNK